MASTLQRVVWFPSRGLNTAQPPHMVPMDMAEDGQDFVVEENTIVKKRDGYANVNSVAVTSTPTINSMFTLSLSNGTKHDLVGTDAGTIYEDSNGTITASVFTSVSTSRASEYTQFLDTALMVDGSNVVKTWDGSTTGLISSAATGAKFIETHLNKIFLAGMSTNTSRIDYSATGDINTWTGVGTDQINVEQNDGQDITGIKSFARNELVIFKERSMYKLIGFDKPSFNLSSIDKSVGCINGRSVQNFKASTGGGLLVFAYIDGIYVYDGASANKISSYVQDVWDNINRTRYDKIVSTIDVDKQRYIISFPTGSSTVNDTTLVVDLAHPWQDDSGFHFPIFKWTVAGQSLYTEFRGTTNIQRVVFGGNADGFKYRFGTLYSDNGSSIDSYIVSPLMAMGDSLSTSNHLRRITTAWVSTAGEIDVDTEIKDGTEWTTQETITTAGEGSAIGVDFTVGLSPIGLPEASFTWNTNSKARSRRIKVRFRQNSSTRFFNLQAPVEFWTQISGKER